MSRRGNALSRRLPEVRERGEHPYVMRVSWLLSHINPSDKVLEIGCGTGWGITIPMLRNGVDALGIDIDVPSVEYGQRLLRQEGLPEDRLAVLDLQEVEGTFDVVILSEVIEHLHDHERGELLRLVRARLRDSGRLLVTVPHGFTLFELEHAVWWKTRLGWLLTRSGFAPIVRRLRQLVVSGETRSRHPSSLSSAPHVQRFTPRSISDRLRDSGFAVFDLRGGCLLAGPFSDLVLRGSHLLEDINVAIAWNRPAIASGLYLACHPTVTASARRPEHTGNPAPRAAWVEPSAKRASDWGASD